MFVAAQLGNLFSEWSDLICIEEAAPGVNDTGCALQHTYERRLVVSSYRLYRAAALMSQPRVTASRGLSRLSAPLSDAARPRSGVGPPSVPFPP